MIFMFLFKKNHFRFVYPLLFFIILIGCQLQEPNKNHGVLFLENRAKKLQINNSNKNDVVKIFGQPHTISIKGSYTLNHRPGLISQIFKTLRYKDYNGQKMWINKIGLRNPGILYGLKHYNAEKDIISIAIMEKEEIKKFNEIIPKDTNLEINVSCPNTYKHMINDGIHVFLNPKRKWCIVKLSP